MNVITSLVNRFLPTHKNSAGLTEARDFLNNGPRNVMMPDWSRLLIGEQDKYTGYMYAGITRRANKVAWLAKYNLKTTANEATTQAAKQAKKDLKHPYLEKIDSSTTFSNGEFWRQIQTFIDLRGEYYLFALRGKVGNTVGEIKEFKLIRPYNITVVYDAAGLEVVGYVETRGSQYREIEPHMIIPMKPLNPNDEQKPFGLADAAKDAQFTLKEASETMRATVRRNRKYSGVIHMGDGEVHIDPESVANLKSRMRNKSANDEPTFTGGEKSSLAWVDMQTDMRKSDIQKVTEINLNEFGAVAGMSKTKLNIEQSGVTRDTADVQDDLFVADHAMPALELILEAMNQDYKTNYPDEYKKTGYTLTIDSPLSEDKVSEQADVEISTSRFELYTTLINKGYDEDTAAAYASGDKDLTEIGKPVNPPILPPVAPGAVPPVDGAPVEGTPPPAKPGKAKTPPAKAKPASNAVILNQVSLADFPGLLDDVDMVPEDLGCIMLDTETLDVLKHVDGGEDELVTSTDRHDHTMGAVAETEAHVTLLFGLLENGNVWKDKVDQVLEDWKIDSITIDKVGSFDLGDSYAVVAHIKKTPDLIDAHERLTLLPHIQTHSEYLPHLTLAYVEHDQAVANKWVKALGKQYNGTTVKTKAINYGDEPAAEAKNAASSGHRHEHSPAAIRNILDQSSKSVLEQQSASLKNTVINIERQMVSAVINKFSQNAFDKQSDIIGDQDRTDAQEALDTALVAFYVIAMSLNAASTMSRRTAEFSLPGTFTIDREVNDYIKLTATRAAESHVNTVLEDILTTIKETTERVIQDEVKKVIPKPGQTDEEILAYAREKALEGVGRERIKSAIRTKYGDTISKVRANTIARTETNRVFGRSQFEVDRQFLTQNDLMGRAYKKWITRSDNPCAFCKAKAAEAPIPFRQAFAKVGDVLKATEETEDGNLKLHQMKVGFEDCMAGEVHPNGECTYQLIIE